MSASTAPTRPRFRAAFTLVEATLAMAIVAVTLVAALSAVGGARLGRQKVADLARGTFLAEDLVAEILAREYDDPVNGGGGGPGADEQTGDRSLFDDVDDYHGWSASPPELPDGTACDGFSGWTRSVQVVYVDPDDVQSVVADDLGVKRVTVTVTHDGRQAGRLVAYRAAEMDP